MQISLRNRWLLVLLLLLTTCLLVTYATRRGSQSARRGKSPFRASSKEHAPQVPRPSPKPAPRPSPKPAPEPVPTPLSRPHFAKHPASNPNFKDNNPSVGSADNRPPAYNPNYRPEGAPPPHSLAGQPAPNVPGGTLPPYQPNQPPSHAAAGQRPPYPPAGGPGVQPPPYPGGQVRPPGYPGLPNAPYPAQPGYPGGYPQQPGVNRPYPVQPGYPGAYPQQPGVNRPYPVQPGHPGGAGGYPQQPGLNRPYPVQPGFHNRPNPQQPLGGNVWQPQSGMPSPAYMNYGGIPTGANMYSKPHKQKGFLGSLMSIGKDKHNPHKQNKYYGSYTSPHGVGGMGGAGMGYRGGGFTDKHGKSAAMYPIVPYKSHPKLYKPRFGSMPIYLPMPHYHHHPSGYGGMYHGHAHYYDVYNSNYAGRCQRPIKRDNTEIRCKSTYDEINCDAECEPGYKFPQSITVVSNKCWHVTGVWRPNKNFPACTPVCPDGCMNGGECLRPGMCSCPPEFRGSRCQFHFLNCDVRDLTKEENVLWACNHKKNETLCKINCKDGVFETPPADEYRCAPDGVWTPNILPRCFVKGKPVANNSTTYAEKKR